MATGCETEHKRLKCNHENVRYMMDHEDDYGTTKTKIFTYCPNCNYQELNKWYVDDCLSQDTLKKIVEAIVNDK
jgi:hypothetical protein